MGLFSKKQTKAPPSLPEEQIVKVVEKFQKWVPDGFSKEINGEIFTATELRLSIELLVRLSNLSQDEQLLVYVAKTCAGFGQSMKDETAESIAQWLFDGTVVNVELRQKYKDYPNALLSITALGLGALSALEKHPKFSDALQYMSDNADELASNK